nr:MAG TPA: hypothetical protein [Bacteriophage sp.]
MYNYLEAMKEDIKEYINNEINLADFANRDELESSLNDDLFTEDSVTGNASGSYTFSRAQAQKYVTDNIDLLNDACENFGTDAASVGEWFLSDDWEKMDVAIRCYLLGQAISETLDDMEDELSEVFESEEE